MKLKVINVGNSKGVIIPKSIAEGMDLKEGDYININIGKTNVLDILKEQIEDTNSRIREIQNTIKEALKL